MQNPYEANQNAEENTKATGCGWIIPVGVALAFFALATGGMLIYRMKMQAAMQREQAMRAMLEAERAKAASELEASQQVSGDTAASPNSEQ